MQLSSSHLQAQLMRQLEINLSASAIVNTVQEVVVKSLRLRRWVVVSENISQRTSVL